MAACHTDFFRVLQRRIVAQQLDRVRQRHALSFHHPIDHRTCGPAAKAVIEIFLIGDRQAGRAFVMKHAAHHPILAAFFQLMALLLDQPNQ